MSTLALCIPAYNAQKYLPVLLSSAKEQAISFNEILVYDDYSTDNTSEIAKQFGATVIQGSVNVGCSSGKNTLAQIAKSDWLHFHDADDDLLNNFTTVAHKWINKENAPDVILMHYHYKDFETGKFIGEPDYNTSDLKKDSVKFTIINKVVNFAVIKKSSFLKIGGFNIDPRVLYNEDRAFYTKAAIEGLTFDYEPELTCINYYYAGSMSVNNRAKCTEAVLHVWNDVIKNTNGKYGKEIAKQLMDNAAYAATADDWKTVKGSIKTARKLYMDIVPGGSNYFQRFYKIFPYYSFYLREMIIRYLTTKRKK